MLPEHGKRWALYASHLGDYMRRWIFRTPWGTLRLHNIRESDAGRDFHDHPFSFTSVILRGGYIEHRPGCVCDGDAHGFRWGAWDAPGLVAVGPCRRFIAPAIVRRKATDFHRLELLDGAHAWTFVISSDYHRTWGFLLPNGTWIHYADYHRSFYGETMNTPKGMEPWPACTVCGVCRPQKELADGRCSDVQLCDRLKASRPFR
jgi:hypothetical protein